MTPSTHECHLTWEQGPWSNQIQMRSPGRTPIQCDWCPEKRKMPCVGTGRAHVGQERSGAAPAQGSLGPPDAAGRTRKGPPAETRGGGPANTFSLQARHSHSEGTNVLFKPPACCHLVRQPQQSNPASGSHLLPAPLPHFPLSLPTGKKAKTSIPLTPPGLRMLLVESATYFELP